MYGEMGLSAVVLRAIDIIVSDLSQSPMDVAHKVHKLLEFYKRTGNLSVEDTAQALVDLL